MMFISLDINPLGEKMRTELWDITFKKGVTVFEMQCQQGCCNDSSQQFSTELKQLR